MENEILQVGMRLINKYNNLNKKAHYYGVDVLLYPSEIHVIDAIGDNNDVTITKLSMNLGITKGGISQTVSKLYGKGLIDKSVGSGINEVYISLTKKGLVAYEEHKKLHNVMNSRLSAFFEGIDDNSRDNIIGLMHIIDEELTRMEENNDF